MHARMSRRTWSALSSSDSSRSTIVNANANTPMLRFLDSLSPLPHFLTLSS